MSSAAAARTYLARLSDVVAVVACFARARFELRGTRRGARVRCQGPLLVRGREGMSIGERSSFLGCPVRTSLRCEPGGELAIGARCLVNYGVEIAARHAVRIGSDCMFGSFVQIRDDDGLRSSPVIVGNGVWIAHGAVLQPGAIIGDQAVIATMTVVSGVVPPRSLVAGNPALSIPLDPATAPPLGASPPGALGPGSVPAPRTPEEVRSAIIDWLDDTRLFGEAARLIASETMSLRDSGLLDSLGFVQLLLMLEGRFGVAIDRRRVARPEAQSLQALIDLVRHPQPAFE
jgi:acetyltransferase-like isoleucine patch superfamily enzyme/acyl carrier protein